MKLVCITGMDGTGKTTLARNTAAALQQQGEPAVYIYGRTFPVISRGLMALGRVMMLRRKDQWRDYQEYATEKKQTMRNSVLAIIYTGTVLLDYYVQIWLKLIPHLFTGRIVVSDRYVYDTVISDLAVHLNYSAEQASRAIERGLRFVPMPMLTARVDVPEEIAFARKDDVPHIDYLRERRPFYLELKNRWEVIELDGERLPSALVQMLLAEIHTHNKKVAGGNAG